MINTNLCGLFYLSRVAIPQMKKQGKGSIVATASTAGLSGDYGLCAYSASKHGTVGLIRTMALDHAKDGIRINCVCPGYMVTPMTTAFREDPAVYEDLVGRIPMGRGADPKEVRQASLLQFRMMWVLIDGGRLGEQCCSCAPMTLRSSLVMVRFSAR